MSHLYFNNILFFQKYKIFEFLQQYLYAIWPVDGLALIVIL